MAWLLGRICDIPIHPQHRLIIWRAAIKTNFLIGNFQTANNLINFLLPIPGLPEQPILLRMQEKCKQENFKETHSPYPTKAVYPMCFQTGRLIKYGKCYMCTVCNATFHPSFRKTLCSFCLGKLDTIEYNPNPN